MSRLLLPTRLRLPLIAPIIRHMMRLPLLACPLLALALIAGCSDTRPMVLQPLDSHKTFSQKFTQAYASWNEDGSIDFLLIDNPAQRQPHRPADAPLRPAAQIPLRQVVHVRIHWLPMHGSSAEPGPANATLEWYIYSDAPDQQSDLLRYSGTGYALARASGGSAMLKLKSSTLSPRIVHNLTDPLGPFHFSGTLTAAIDPQQLHSILDATRSRLGLPEE